MMVEEFITAFNIERSRLRSLFESAHPNDYKELVRWVVEAISHERDYGLDPERITEVSYGGYEGVLCFVIAEKGFSPSRFWGVTINYGSCSVCDTLEALRLGDEKPEPSSVEGYMSLALQVVQGLRSIHSERDER